MPHHRLLIGAATGLALAAAVPARAPTIAGCRVLPASNAFNEDVSRAPVLARSAAYVASIGATATLHPDFGSGRYGDFGIPITIAEATQRKVPIRFTAYGDESDAGPYPVPLSARVEGGRDSDGDRHVIVVQRSRCTLYELYDAHRSGRGWAAASGAVFDLRREPDRPKGWTSADAAGLPIAPGLARADEATHGTIRHAIRVTVPRSQKAFVAPARHSAGDSTDPSLPPMGLRLRLKASYPTAGFHGQAKAIAVALKRYGMIVADNGSPWFISGTADRRWNDDQLDELKRIPGSAFEAVKP